MKNIVIPLLIFGFSIVSYAQDDGEIVRDDITGSIERDTTLKKFVSGTTQAGRDPEFGFCYDFQKLHYFGPSYVEQDLQKARWSKTALNVLDEHVEQHEWIEIDLCARTMMAEIGTEKACGNPDDDAYQVALARVIANRAKMSKAKAKKLPEGDNINALLFPTQMAVEEKQQFSVWNANAKIEAGAACPSRTGPDAANWRNMIYLCKTAIKDDGKRIRSRTTQMTDDMMYYTSGCRMHYTRMCEGYTKHDVEISGTKIDNYRCFELWKPGENPKDKQEKACLAKARTCCTGPELRVVQKAQPAQPAIPPMNGKPGRPAKAAVPEKTKMVDTDSIIQSKATQCEQQAPNWLKTQTASK